MDAQSGCYEFESLPIFREPLCLIDEDINIVPEVLKQVKTIDCPLVVVAVTGLYRTGKSYLMNRLAGLKRGFQLGHTVEPETKGIWALCKINPTKRDHVLMFLDTEGLCYVGKEDSSHDNKIFVLSTLLSNVLLYNIYSCFNSDAIEKTTFITELSKNIKFQNTKEEDSSDKLHTIMPTFVLCLRDFCLCLEKDGVEISADEYLEACLEINCKHGVYDRDSDWARKCIKKYFPQRKCFTFDRPADRMNINRLEDTYEANLSEEFREDIDRLRKYIYNLTPVASANSIPVTGTVFSHLVRTYTQAIREGKIPDVDDAFTVAKKFENERKRQNAILEFQSQISQIKLPILDKIELESSFEKIQKSVVTTFRPQFTLAAYGIKAEKEMDRLLQRKRKENSTLINAFLTKRLQSMYDNVIGRPISNKYVKPGGFRKYKLEMDRLKRQYKAEMKGVNEYEVQKALIYFIGSKMVRENELMMSEELPEENETCEPLTLIQREANELQQTCQSVATDVLYKSELSLQKLRATTKENITKTDASYQTILNELTRTMEILEELALSIKMQQQSEEKMFLKHLEDLRMEKPLNEEDENKSLELLLEQLSYVSFSEDLDF